MLKDRGDGGARRVDDLAFVGKNDAGLRRKIGYFGLDQRQGTKVGRRSEVVPIEDGAVGLATTRLGRSRQTKDSDSRIRREIIVTSW